MFCSIGGLRVPAWNFYRTYRNSGYGYGTQTSQKFRVLSHGRTELTEVLGRYKHVVPVPQDFLARAYITCKSSGYGYTRVNTRLKGAKENSSTCETNTRGSVSKRIFKKSNRFIFYESNRIVFGPDWSKYESPRRHLQFWSRESRSDRIEK